MQPPRDPIDLEAVLRELGACGRYQLRTYCLILLPIVLSGVYISQYVFNAAELDYRCAVPQCESSPPQFPQGEWGAWALPEDARCERRLPLADSCTPDAFHPNETLKCTAWIYRTRDTIVAEFDLACQAWKRTLVGSVHSAGLLTALSFTGFVSDAFGRRTAFILTAWARSLVGLARAFSTSYTMYLVFEYLDATVGSGVYTCGFVLALELVHLEHRVLGGNLMSSAFALGQVLLALVAWAVPYWRTLTLVLYAPSLLFVLYFFVLDESVRWLLSKGRKREAASILYRAAAINRTTLSAKAVQQLESDTRQPARAPLAPPGAAPLHSLAAEVLRSRIIMSRLCICSFWWMTVTFIYYGLSINSVSLAGNMYINYILTSLAEIPGYCVSVLTLDRFGRKSSIMMAFLICGITLLALPFVPDAWTSTLSVLGKMCISMAFSSIYVYTLELFPTGVRHRVLAGLSMLGRLGQIAAPQVPLLMAYAVWLPYLLFGALALAAAALMLLTPETLRMRLPDTVRQAEDIALAPRT